MKIYRAIMKIIVNSVGAAFVVPFYEEFIKHINRWASVLIAAIASSAIIILLDIIFLEIPYLFRKIRKNILPIAEMEGVWVEVATEGERVVSIAHLDYDCIRKKHKYYGEAFDKNGIIKATWFSSHLSHESGDGVHAFTFTGEGDYIIPHKKVRTVGQVSFRSIDPLHPHKLSVGHGAYYDYDIDAEDTNNLEIRNVFDMYKLTADDYIKYIGKKKPTSNDDWKEFVINYYKQHKVLSQNTINH